MLLTFYFCRKVLPRGIRSPSAQRLPPAAPAPFLRPSSRKLSSSFIVTSSFVKRTTADFKTSI